MISDEEWEMMDDIEREECNSLFRNCLHCANSFSEPCEKGDILHCMEHGEVIVEEDYCCEDYN